MKIGFVILHYYALDMTCKCIDKILDNFSGQDIELFIIDNHSSNGSGNIISQQYSDNELVTVILNDENLGFAKGNNIGYQLAKQKNCDFIVVMNNDVLIEDSDFINKIIKIYSSDRFAILGPDIINPILQFHQSPIKEKGYTKEAVEKLIIKQIKKKRYLFFYSLKHIFFERLKPFYYRRKKISNPLAFEKHKNVVLHGACYIFSKDYISHMDYAFYPDTFLYFEEDILYRQCEKNNFKILYDPSVFVYHLEDVSTNMVYRNYLKKEKMKISNLINSMRVFMDIY